MRTKIILFLALVIPLVLAYKAFFLPGQLVWGDAPYFSNETLKTLVNLIPAWTQRGHNFGGPLDFYWAYPLILLFGLGHKLLGLENAALIRIVFYFPSIILAVVGGWWYAKKQGLNLLGQYFASLIYSLNTYILLLVDGGQVGVALAYGLFPFGEYLPGLILLSVADFRIALIYLLFQLLSNFKSWSKVLKRGLILVGLHAYWWYPMLKLGASSLSTSVSGLQLTSLLNSLLLYQPHWPLNDYGKTTQPLFYFALIPILILSSKKWRQILIFLIFAFLAKGESAPFGSVYSYILNHISVAAAFRDSTKFFIPLMLLGAVLIGSTLQKYKTLAMVAYFYLLLLVYPALMGQLQGVLAGRQDVEIRPSQTTGRVLWFDQKPPLGYESKELPALDAKRLVENRIFASYNIGNDVYNFFTQDKTKSYQWLKLLDNKTFTVKSVTLVVGPDDISSPLTNPAIYVEDGRVNLENLVDIDKDALSILFNHKTKLDLQMAFLQKYFVSPNKTNWATGKPEDYLKWKYELLIRGLDFKDFTHGKNIYYSTQKGEKLEFNFKIPKGQYYLAVRRLKVGKLEWEVSKQGTQFEIVNDSDLDVVNVAAIIPEDDWVKAGRDADNLIANHNQITKLPLLENGSKWLIFTDSYHPKWQLVKNTEKHSSFPIYSAINGFYLGKWDISETKMFFSGQDDVRFGALYSVLTILLLIIYYLYRYDQKVSDL